MFGFWRKLFADLYSARRGESIVFWWFRGSGPKAVPDFGGFGNRSRNREVKGILAHESERMDGRDEKERRFPPWRVH
uniref:Uncharacterized protein n=1 Tax=Globodera rostochiensis TaxID=31243 RepID=A0A914GVM4_GLORO